MKKSFTTSLQRIEVTGYITAFKTEEIGEYKKSQLTKVKIHLMEPETSKNT